MSTNSNILLLTANYSTKFVVHFEKYLKVATLVYYHLIIAIQFQKDVHMDIFRDHQLSGFLLFFSNIQQWAASWRIILFIFIEISLKPKSDFVRRHWFRITPPPQKKLQTKQKTPNKYRIASFIFEMFKCLVVCEYSYKYRHATINACVDARLELCNNLINCKSRIQYYWLS